MSKTIDEKELQELAKKINTKYGSGQTNEELLKEMLENPEDSKKVTKLFENAEFKKFFDAVNTKANEKQSHILTKTRTPLELESFKPKEIMNIVINKIRRGDPIIADDIVPPEVIDISTRLAVININLSISKIAAKISDYGESADMIEALKSYLYIVGKER